VPNHVFIRVAKFFYSAQKPAILTDFQLSNKYSTKNVIHMYSRFKTKFTFL